MASRAREPRAPRALGADLPTPPKPPTAGLPNGRIHRDRIPTPIPMVTKELTGYGELFRWLSYQEIGPAAMLSRAIGGLIGAKVVLTMPGSPAGVRLAMEKIILPELGHMVREARR